MNQLDQSMRTMKNQNILANYRHERMSKNKHCFIWLYCLAFVLPVNVFALGFRIPNQDAEATARGNAYVATADNPSAIYYNSAGITHIKGLNVQFGGHAISVNSHFESSSGAIEADTKSELQLVPQIFCTYAPEDSPFAFGLGIYVPFGLGLEWPDAVPFRDYALEGRLQYTTVNPVVAWQITPTLSIGVGPTINYGLVNLRQGFGGIPGSNFEFEGDGFAFGGKVGLLWQPHPKWSLGLNYCSPTTVNFDGDSTAVPGAPNKTSTSAEMDFPQFIVGGISFRPTTNWNVEVDIDWTDWDTLNTVTFENTAFGDVPLRLNWESSFLYHLGITRYLQNHYWVSAGYFFSENSTSQTDFTPVVPDTDLHVVSLGVGRKGEHWSWALSGQIITGPERNVDNGNATDGTYQFSNQAVNFSVAYRF